MYEVYDGLTPEEKAKITDLRACIGVLSHQIAEATRELMELQAQICEVLLALYKIGDYVLAEVSVGKGKQWTKCLIELEAGHIYLRPVRKDGELSGKHFIFTPSTTGNLVKYSGYFKPVEE